MSIITPENTIAVFTGEIAGIIVYTVKHWTFAEIVARVSENEFSEYRTGTMTAMPDDLSVIDWTVYYAESWQMQEIPVNKFFAENKIYATNQYNEIIF
jgi:hypothetical protein